MYDLRGIPVQYFFMHIFCLVTCYFCMTYILFEYGSVAFVYYLNWYVHSYNFCDCFVINYSV